MSCAAGHAGNDARLRLLETEARCGAPLIGPLLCNLALRVVRIVRQAIPGLHVYKKSLSGHEDTWANEGMP